MAGNPTRVDVGSVDEIESGVHGAVELAEAVGFGDRPAVDVAAEADGGPFRAVLAQFSGLHSSFSLALDEMPFADARILRLADRRSRVRIDPVQEARLLCRRGDGAPPMQDGQGITNSRRKR